MYYVYILWSSKSKDFYYGYTQDLKKRLREHNKGLSKATAPYTPWKLVFYAAFENKKLAENFERQAGLRSWLDENLRQLRAKRQSLLLTVPRSFGPDADSYIKYCFCDSI